MLDIKLSVGGVAVPLGYDCIKSLLDIIPDESGYDSVLWHLAKYGGAKARNKIAGRWHIDTETVKVLFHSGDVNARRELLSNSIAHAALIQEEILELVDSSDPELIEALIDNLTQFPHCEARPIFKRLGAHPDPWVRGLVAACTDTPESVLWTLIRDEDRDVVDKANKTIERKVEMQVPSYSDEEVEEE